MSSYTFKKILLSDTWLNKEDFRILVINTLSVFMSERNTCVLKGLTFPQQISS